MQSLHPGIKDWKTWLQPFLLFLLSFAVRASSSKHLTAILSQIDPGSTELAEDWLVNSESLSRGAHEPLGSKLFHQPDELPAQTSVRSV